MTGFEQNPLAGVLGILTMMGLAIGLMIARNSQVRHQ
jgi:hypothetical protein